jgi:hypothetical protein
MNQFPQAPEYTIRAVSNFSKTAPTTTPVANLPRVSTTLVKLVAKFAAGVIDTVGKFATSVVDTGGKFDTGMVLLIRWFTLTCEYLRKFSNKFETVLMGYSGAGGKLIHEKTRCKKSRDTVTLNYLKRTRLSCGRILSHPHPVSK